jgi:ubiquinone/menaquinone biosynthesis C-methylase UbiE
MRRIDYDRRLHSVYARGRAMPREAIDTWMAALARHADGSRPLTVLDLGSGTGRFSPALAQTFGGPVYGVEPSQRMISVARSQSDHPRVHYLRGMAEAIPLGDGSVDVALLYFVLHHVAHKRAAAAELRRVLRPGGRLFIRTNFTDRMPDIYWYQFFARAKEVDRSLFQSVAEVAQLLESAGFAVVALEDIEFLEAASKVELLERLRCQALSTFELMDPCDIDEGFAAMEAAIAKGGDSAPVFTRGDLLVLRRE